MTLRLDWLEWPDVSLCPLIFVKKKLKHYCKRVQKYAYINTVKLPGSVCATVIALASYCHRPLELIHIFHFSLKSLLVKPPARLAVLLSMSARPEQVKTRSFEFYRAILRFFVPLDTAEDTRSYVRAHWIPTHWSKFSHIPVLFVQDEWFGDI